MTPKATPQPSPLHSSFEKIREGITTYGVGPYFCVFDMILEEYDNPNALGEVAATTDWFLAAYGELGSERMRKILDALDNLARPAPPKAPALDVNLMCKLARPIVGAGSALRIPTRLVASLCGKQDDTPIHYIYELAQQTEAELLKRKHFGRAALRQIRDLLSYLGLHLGMQIDPAMIRAVREEIAKQSGRETHALP